MYVFRTGFGRKGRETPLRVAPRLKAVVKNIGIKPEKKLKEHGHPRLAKLKKVRKHIQKTSNL